MEDEVENRSGKEVENCIVCDMSFVDCMALVLLEIESRCCDHCGHPIRDQVTGERQ